MRSVGTYHELSGTIGQPDTAESLTMTGTTLSLTGGFWAGATAPVPGDCTGDNVVDLYDYDVCAPCLTGPDINVSAGCTCADWDGDGDLRDFPAFQRVFEPQ